MTVDTAQDARRQRLSAMADDCLEVYDPDAAEALKAGAPVPRYAMLTAESGHEGNPNLSVSETVDELTERATGEANEQYVWTPQRIVDLDTGHELDWFTKVEVVDPFARPQNA